jgi:fibronectin type 3 domain-containing protein
MKLIVILLLVASAWGQSGKVSLSGRVASGGKKGQHWVELTWVASTTPTVIGYNIYRGVASGGPYTKMNSNVIAPVTYSDNIVVKGQTYYYVTTAIDGDGVTESVYSNEAVAVIP